MLSFSKHQALSELETLEEAYLWRLGLLPMEQFGGQQLIQPRVPLSHFK
jgi:hypothetical protein